MQPTNTTLFERYEHRIEVVERANCPDPCYDIMIGGALHKRIAATAAWRKQRVSVVAEAQALAARADLLDGLDDPAKTDAQRADILAERLIERYARELRTLNPHELLDRCRAWYVDVEEWMDRLDILDRLEEAYANQFENVSYRDLRAASID